MTPTRTEGAGVTPIPFVFIDPNEIATTTASTKALETTQNALDASTSAKGGHVPPWRQSQLSWQQQPLHQQMQQPLQQQMQQQMHQHQQRLPTPPPPPPPLPQPTTSGVMEPLRPIPPPPRWQDLGQGRGGVPSRMSNAAKRAKDPHVQERAAKWAKARADKDASKPSVYLEKEASESSVYLQ